MEPADLPQPWSSRFSLAARTVAVQARSLGLVAPGFRSPPASPAAVRTMRRFADGRCIVAVRAAGRPHAEVIRDLVEGVIAANGLSGAAADHARSRLLDAVAPVTGAQAA
ncbi:MAG TPA: hypothetical protein VM345_14720 [Acidimicrobiales bacterium]|nr:hypothetical protein [Acidimicrobiales bacterium]